ncbi:pyrroloquinoline quinone biosynthesis peptide chaperone PqqD [Streptomyces sp. NPDC059688]|uniref:Pyrroloquinoline quinone biosynthesis peptide chaperone PqqD n=2 Tax=Streptomyces TaxID=1883 RepID=A0ABV1U3R9_9ACTN|nr:MULTISPECIES: pyrroloquinoline quinone biosynthesis peptide chaperone PqqD [unclassified Streptomyces]OKJ79161.1 pyrroloquinoline quinone biosynthesis protein [Streptomyces sp. CB01883]UXY39908.1 pyrroloquinoline quinone biosynthesis peptide chaperone PqqD [Streptomyces sp. HUAS 14-6]
MDPPPTGTTQTGTRTRPGVEVSDFDRPRLPRHVRLAFCRTRRRRILLHPETVVVLNGSGGAVIELCDGRHTVTEIVTELGARYQAVSEDEVRQFLTQLVSRRWLELTDG